jgi:hypothetical protein
MTKKKRRKLPLIVPPRGPATNLRPAGAHEMATKYNRKRAKAALRGEDGYSHEVDLSVD